MQTPQEADTLIAALDPKRVARKFSRKLVEWLSSEEMRLVRLHNLGEKPFTVCHSHDYCDANQAMLCVFEELGLEDMSTDGGFDWSDEIQDKFNDLWTKAWGIAFAAHFKAKDIKG